jgi:hypothetical protein
LDGIDVVGDEPGCVAGGRVGVEGFLAVVGGVEVEGGAGRGELGAVEVEAEEGVGVEVVEGGPGAVPVIGEFGVGAVAGDAEVFPFGDICFGYILWQ